LLEVVPVYHFWGGDCYGGEGYRLVIASHLVIDFPARGTINSIYGDQFDQMLVILYIVAIVYIPDRVSRLGGTNFSLFIRMISNLAVVAVCTDHEDQTKKVRDEKKNENNNVKGDSCPGFHTFGKAEPPRTEARDQGSVSENVCAQGSSIYLFSPRECQGMKPCEYDSVQIIPYSATLVKALERLLRKAPFLGDNHGYRTERPIDRFNWS